MAYVLSKLVWIFFGFCLLISQEATGSLGPAAESLSSLLRAGEGRARAQLLSALLQTKHKQEFDKGIEEDCSNVGAVTDSSIGITRFSP